MKSFKNKTKVLMSDDSDSSLKDCSFSSQQVLSLNQSHDSSIQVCSISIDSDEENISEKLNISDDLSISDILNEDFWGLPDPSTQETAERNFQNPAMGKNRNKPRNRINNKRKPKKLNKLKRPVTPKIRFTRSKMKILGEQIQYKSNEKTTSTSVRDTKLAKNTNIPDTKQSNTNADEIHPLPLSNEVLGQVDRLIENVHDKTVASLNQSQASNNQLFSTISIDSGEENIEMFNFSNNVNVLNMNQSADSNRISSTIVLDSGEEDKEKSRSFDNNISDIVNENYNISLEHTMEKYEEGCADKHVVNKNKDKLKGRVSSLNQSNDSNNQVGSTISIDSGEENIVERLNSSNNLNISDILNDDCGVSPECTTHQVEQEYLQEPSPIRKSQNKRKTSITNKHQLEKLKKPKRPVTPKVRVTRSKMKLMEQQMQSKGKIEILEKNLKAKDMENVNSTSISARDTKLSKKDTIIIETKQLSTNADGIDPLPLNNAICGQANMLTKNLNDETVSSKHKPVKGKKIKQLANPTLRVTRGGKNQITTQVESDQNRQISKINIEDNNLVLTANIGFTPAKTAYSPNKNTAVEKSKEFHTTTNVSNSLFLNIKDNERINKSTENDKNEEILSKGKPKKVKRLKQIDTSKLNVTRGAMKQLKSQINEKVQITKTSLEAKDSALNAKMSCTPAANAQLLKENVVTKELIVFHTSNNDSSHISLNKKDNGKTNRCIEKISSIKSTVQTEDASLMKISNTSVKNAINNTEDTAVMTKTQINSNITNSNITNKETTSVPVLTSNILSSETNSNKIIIYSNILLADKENKRNTSNGIAQPQNLEQTSEIDQCKKKSFQRFEANNFSSTEKEVQIKSEIKRSRAKLYKAYAESFMFLAFGNITFFHRRSKQANSLHKKHKQLDKTLSSIIKRTNVTQLNSKS